MVLEKSLVHIILRLSNLSTIERIQCLVYHFTAQVAQSSLNLNDSDLLCGSTYVRGTSRPSTSWLEQVIFRNYWQGCITLRATHNAQTESLNYTCFCPFYLNHHNHHNHHAKFLFLFSCVFVT